MISLRLCFDSLKQLQKVLEALNFINILEIYFDNYFACMVLYVLVSDKYRKDLLPTEQHMYDSNKLLPTPVGNMSVTLASDC